MKGWIFFVLVALGNVEAYTKPSDETIAAAQEIQKDGGHLLEFYEALKDLYLSKGFEVSNPFNAAILGEKPMYEVVYQQVISVLIKTRGEIRKGDVGFKSLKSWIGIDSPEGLLFQPWLNELLSFISYSKVENPKDFAFSIRDLGTDLLANNLTRTDYQNGTFLLNHINNWISAQNFQLIDKEAVTDLPLLLVNIHHVIGPERFDELANLLELFPFKPTGIDAEDQLIISYIRALEYEALATTDQTVRVFQKFLNGYQDYTKTAKDAKESAIDQLVRNDLDVNVTIRGFKGENVDSNDPPRHQKSQEEISKILETLKFSDKTEFVEAVITALSNGIGDVGDVRNALVIAARLQQFSPEPEEFVDQVVAAVKLGSYWPQLIPFANDLLVRLPNNTRKILQAYNVMPEEANQLFRVTKWDDLTLVQALIKSLENVEPDEILSVVRSIIGQKMDLATLKASLPGNNITQLGDFIEKFNISDVLQASSLANVLQKVVNVVSENSFNAYLSTIQKLVTRTGDDYEKFIEVLYDASKKTRDGTWTDMFLALQDLAEIFGGGEVSRTPFLNLPPRNGISEVLEAMEMLVEGGDVKRIELRAQLVKTILQGTPRETFRAFGIVAKNIENWNKATRSNDDLIRLLEASGTYQVFLTMFEFHQKNTTNKDSNESLKLISDMIRYLESLTVNQ